MQKSLGPSPERQFRGKAPRKASERCSHASGCSCPWGGSFQSPERKKCCVLPSSVKATHPSTSPVHCRASGSSTPRPEAVFTTGIGLSLRCFRGAQWPSGVACLNMGATWKSLPHCLKNPRPVPHGLRVLETGIRICPDPESLHIYLFG